MGGPYVGPRGGLWADPQHTVHWDGDRSARHAAHEHHAVAADGRPKRVVADSSGHPLVVYQGNNSSAMHTDPAKRASGEFGVYVTPSRAYAARYGENVHRAHVKIRRPLFVENKGEIAPGDLTKEHAAELIARGYDAIVVAPRGSRDYERANEIVLLEPGSLIDTQDKASLRQALDEWEDWEYMNKGNTLLDVFRMTTLQPGWVELPAAYVEGLLAKGAGHKYIKRVPKAGGGFRYFYHVGHGHGVAHEDHFVDGASFRGEGGHYHITAVDGDKLTVRHDETGKVEHVTKAELRKRLEAHHGEALKKHREKVAADLAEARANKASPKQIKRLEERAKAAGVSTKHDTSGDVEAVLEKHGVPEKFRGHYRTLSADEALSVAKQAREEIGKNRIGVMTRPPQRQQEHDERSRATAELHEALAEAKSGSKAAGVEQRAEAAKPVIYGKDTAAVRDYVRLADNLKEATDRRNAAMDAGMDSIEQAGANAAELSQARQYIQRVVGERYFRPFGDYGAGAFPALKRASPDVKRAVASAANDAYLREQTVNHVGSQAKEARDRADDLRHRRNELDEKFPGLTYRQSVNGAARHVSDFLAGRKASLTAREMVESVHNPIARDADGGRQSAEQSAWHKDTAKVLRAIHSAHGDGGDEAAFHEKEAAKHDASIKAEAMKAKAAADERERKRKAEEDAAERERSDTAKGVAAKVKAAVGELKAPGKFDQSAKPLPLDKAHARAKGFVSSDDTRDSITSVHAEGGKVYATDGHRLAIIPTSHEGTRTMSKKSHEETASAPFIGVEAVSALTNKAPEHEATYDAQSLAKLVQQFVDTQVEEGRDRKAVSGSGRAPRVVIHNGHVGEWHQDSAVPTPHSGSAAPKVGLHAKYLLDALKGAKGNVKIGTIDEFSPVHITHESGEHHVVMPIRI